MALYCITCSCGSSEQLTRQCLHRYGYKNWAMEKIYKDKTPSLSKVEELIRKYPDSQELRALYSHINNSSKWVVILGIKNNIIRWADIARGDMKSDIEAESIIENLA